MGSAPSSDIAIFDPRWLLCHSWFEIVHGGQEQYSAFGARTMRELDCGQMAYTFRWNQSRGLIEFQQDCIVEGKSKRRRSGLVEVPDMKNPGYLVFYNITDHTCLLTWRVLDYHPNWLVVENQNLDIHVFYSCPTIDICSYNALMERLRTIGLPTNRFIVNNGVITQPVQTCAPVTTCAPVVPSCATSSCGLMPGPSQMTVPTPAPVYTTPAPVYSATVPGAIAAAPVAAVGTAVGVPVAAAGGAVVGAAQYAPQGVVYPQPV